MDAILADRSLATILFLSTVVALAVLATALRKLARRHRMRHYGRMQILVEDPAGQRYSLKAADLSYDDLMKLVDVLDANASRRRPLGREAGSISLQALLMIMPAVIALAFVAVILYMAVKSEPIPEPLVGWLTTIIGYYFGVGASSLAQGRQVTPQEAQRIIATQAPERP